MTPTAGLGATKGAPLPGRGRPSAKICGLVRPTDARFAAEQGADWIGVVLVPNTPRARSAAEAAELRRAAEAGSPGIRLAIVVDATDVDEIVHAARVSGASALQLHGDQPVSLAQALRQEGDWELWRAERVRAGHDLLPMAERWAQVVDLLLLDGWHPTQLGGAGVSFPWEALEAVRATWPSGLALGAAGGLRPGTVGEAIVRLTPDLVDVSSGVEAAPGIKDPERIRAFLEAVQRCRTSGPVEGSGA